MPANNKHLIQSNFTKFSKVFAALIVAMIASISLHLALALCIGYSYIIPTSLFSIFILWGFLMIMVYWIKSPWKSWGILLLTILISIVVIYLAKN